MEAQENGFFLSTTCQIRRPLSDPGLGRRLLLGCCFEVVDAAVETLFLQGEKPVVLIESDSAGVDSVDDEGSCAVVTGACDGAGGGVEEQVGSEAGAVVAPIKGETGEE